MTQRLLVLSHGHPRFNRGGGEHAAYAVHQHIGERPGWESLFLAAAPEDWPRAEAELERLDDSREWLLRPTDDWLLFSSAVDLSAGCALQQWVQAWRPDVVHIHHFHRLGLDVVLAIVRWCPQARIVFTLHEFLPLCPYQGQLLTRQGQRCDGPSLPGCSGCLPAIDPADLRLREALMRTLMDCVHAFITPSQQLARVYEGWGLDRCRLHGVEYALPPALLANGAAALPAPAGAPCAFGFFGNVLPSKGLDLLLDAFERLGDRSPAARLHVFGQVPGDAAALQQRLQRLGARVQVRGGYSQEEVPELMRRVHWVVMGSRWRENSPVVILEAKACRRPLLVPALGGMAEKVRDGLDGWHYEPDDPADLAERLGRCCRSRLQWERLAAGMAEPVGLEQIIGQHLTVYTAAAGDQNLISTEA